MIHTVIDKKNKRFYTYLGDVFRDMGSTQTDYNWLVVPYECYPQTTEFVEMFARDFAFLSGDELSRLIAKEDLQWIWAVFCLFEKDVPLSEILKHPISRRDYWPNTEQPQMLHPLSAAELYACDSSCTILLSRSKALADAFRRGIKSSAPGRLSPR